ncbi:hypothetical protein PIB30_012941 [Stylosanthes scabra]|uniref:Chlorophyll a-b binding protein, chloroplastic n=1 Tax=Stylosanthes scabra TaxID=79078 RepID=A0ABU6Y4F2_9FABA|nr:hypothetical protein [Stylosanthes scabra]
MKIVVKLVSSLNRGLVQYISGLILGLMASKTGFKVLKNRFLSLKKSFMFSFPPRRCHVYVSGKVAIPKWTSPWSPKGKKHLALRRHKVPEIPVRAWKSEKTLVVQSASQGSASQGSREDKLFEMLANLQKKLDEEQRLNVKARKEHGAKIDSMAETVGGHGILLSSLIKRSGGTGSSDSVTARCTRSRGHRGRRSGVSERGRGRGKSQPPSGAETSRHPLNPETYYNHISIWVEGAPLPKAIELEFPLPHGLFFAGMELAVASYIFGKGLPMGDVLCPNDCCLGDRRAQRSLMPEAMVMDDVNPVLKPRLCALLM